MKTKPIYLVALLLLFYSCADKKEQAQLPPQEIEVYQVKPQDVPIYEEFVGQIYGAKDIPIRARVDGFLEKIYFHEGLEVKKGQLLYAIDPDPLIQQVAQAQSLVSEAKTMLSQKESDLNRVKPLAEMAAVSQRDLDMAQAQRDAAISSLDAAEAQLKIAQINLGYAKIYSPINGVIGKTLAREGEYVGKDPNPVILNTVSEIEHVRIQFFLSENQYIKFAREFREHRKDPDAEVKKSSDLTLELILADGSKYEHTGHIDFIDRNIDATTGSILVQATFPNSDAYLRPGQFARIVAKIRVDKGALLVPQKSVSELQGQYSVLVVEENNEVALKHVTIDEKYKEFYTITEGIKPGDKIVFEGIQKVKPGMQVVPKVVPYQSQTKAE